MSGRRLDAEAPPLEVFAGGEGREDLQVGSLTFPTEGCWEIVAQSGNSVLRFVMYIHAVHVSS